MERYIKFLSLVNSTHKCVQKILTDELAKYGLRGADAQYLLALYMKRDGYSLSDLADAVENDKAAVSRAYTHLEEEGVVLRAVKRYKMPIVLTDKGVAIAEKLIERANKAIVLVGANISEEEKMDFYQVFGKTVENLKFICENGLDD